MPKSADENAKSYRLVRFQWVIIKQLKNNDQTGLTKDELIDYRYNIHQCVITCAKALVEAIGMSNIRTESNTNNDHYSYLRGYIVNNDSDAPLNEKVGKVIDDLWKDSSIAEAFKSRDKSNLIDSAR